MQVRKDRVILYPRVSSKKQLIQGDSIEAQISRLKQFCQENNYDVVDIYTDSGKSATIKDDDLRQRINGHLFTNEFNINIRPAFKRLLVEAPKKNFDAIVFYKWDRYSRDIAFAELSIKYFSNFGIKLIPSDDSQDLLTSSIMRVIGNVEIERMKARVKLGRSNNFNKGVIVGRCPFGYKPIFKDKRHKRGIIKIVPHKNDSVIVKSIFERTANGESYLSICKDYKLKPQSYYNILRNKVYIGIVSFEGEERKGIHEPIISEELFNKVNSGSSS